MIKVGIIRGGAGENYEQSLEDGAEVFNFIKENFADKFKPVDIFIDKDNIWHMGGLPVMPSDLHHRADVFWNMAHGEVVPILDNFSAKHVSVSNFSQTLLRSQDILREHMMQSIGVNMPQHLVLPAYQEDIDGGIEKYAQIKAKMVFEKFGSPWIVRSYSKDISMGEHVAKTFPELVNAIIDGAEHGGSMIVEELIAGKEVVAHSLKNFRALDTYIMPFGNLSNEEKEKLTNIVRGVHRETGDNHYLHSTFIITPRRGVYLKKISFTPSLGNGSHLEESSSAAGIKVHQILEHILENAIR